jgi:hypothetical protein
VRGVKTRFLAELAFDTLQEEWAAG